ncbi:MAG: 2-phospho-L-lactate transferase [Methanomicrobiaceae archaeon]|uniref:Lactyl (2) diphospho-(5') guanosine:7,8-didemethyl-8-hydroxy-5-deazariboflavin 2-phospho-l-lactate transferase n=1 Tax=hydrocarbon metagenome TaxID=938273 RepID=A0A0W8FFZ9_9ZZZZ|nr:2-phospho-L-lactate transferase [Methanomicrobiaceae archaeon]MDD5418796.1 2-phospho-L-lactate transferase CofD family protein [Methanomicrobiaceae archaeon]
MITFLAGGTGTPRLLRGVRQIVFDPEIAVVANTAEDSWISGNHLSPTLDTLMFLFAGILNTRAWQGIRGDTFATHRYLERVGGREVPPIGDRARAFQIARANMLRQGRTISEAARVQGDALGITATILPMTDAAVATSVETGDGIMPVSVYCSEYAGDAGIRRILRSGEEAVATDAVLAALLASDAVIIGPDNPARGILPILACRGVADALEDRFVIAVSPFRDGALEEGCGAAFMRAAGYEPTSSGAYCAYADIVDVFVQDIRDPVEVEGSLRLNTRMWRERDSESLAWDIIAIVRQHAS